MKVSEYIKLLQQLPQDAEVLVMTSDDRGDFVSKANEPYYGKEPFDERFVGGYRVLEYTEGVIIKESNSRI